MSSDREVLYSHGLVLSYPNATPGPISESHNNSTIQLLKWLLPPDNPTRSVVSKFLSHPTLRTPSAGTQGLEDGFFLAVLAYHVLPPHVSPNIFLPRLLSTNWGISDRMPLESLPITVAIIFALLNFTRLRGRYSVLCSWVCSLHSMDGSLFLLGLMLEGWIPLCLVRLKATRRVQSRKSVISMFWYMFQYFLPLKTYKASQMFKMRTQRSTSPSVLKQKVSE